MACVDFVQAKSLPRHKLLAPDLSGFNDNLNVNILEKARTKAEVRCLLRSQEQQGVPQELILRDEEPYEARTNGSKQPTLNP